jgi:membrane protein implicated in regulation of membrane protease activity
MFGALLLLAVLSAMSWRRYRVQWRKPRPTVPAREKELVG